MSSSAAGSRRSGNAQCSGGWSIEVEKTAQESRPGVRCRRRLGGGGGGRSIDDAGAELLHLQDGERAIGRTVGEEAEGTIDTCKSARPRERGSRVALALPPPGHGDRHA